MNREKELAKNTIIIFAGKICTQFLSFFLLPIYTRVLSSDEYGLVDLYTTCQMLIIYVVYAQIEQAFFRFLVDQRKNAEQRSTISSTVFVYYVGVSLILGGAFFFFCCLIEIEYSRLLYVNVILCALTNIFQQYLRGLGDNLGYSIGSFICAMTTIIGNIVFLVYLRLGAEGMLWGNMVGYILSALYMLYRSQAFLFFKINLVSKRVLKDLLFYSLPLVPNALSWWVMSASDRIIVSFVLGNSATGILAVAQKFSTVYSNMYTMFHMSWSESASLYINEGDKDFFFQEIINSMLRLFASIAVGIILIMPFAFPILVDKNYNLAYNVIPIYVLSAFFNVVQGLYSVVYIALKKTKEIAKTTMLAAIINLVVNILCIWWIGIYAAAVSSLISYLVIGMYRYNDIKKYINAPIHKKDIFTISILFIVSIGCYYVHNLAICGVALISGVVFCVAFNQEILLQAFVIIKRKIRGLDNVE